MAIDMRAAAEGLGLAMAADGANDVFVHGLKKRIEACERAMREALWQIEQNINGMGASDETKETGLQRLRKAEELLRKVLV